MNRLIVLVLICFIWPCCQKQPLAKVATNRGNADRNESLKHIEIIARGRSVVVFIFTRDTTALPLVQTLDSIILQTIKSYENEKRRKENNRCGGT